ncbi:MAG: Hsp20/alpha crystallin family protein [Bacteroidetes bacterium]|nr:Hsp20/alpha crystallin family protein [Bacteroidota bacterium]
MLFKIERAPRLRSSIDDIFDVERSLEGLFGDFLGSRRIQGSSDYPAIEVSDHEKEVVLLAELPGVRKEDVKVTVHDGLLTIKGERKPADSPEKSTWLRSEIARGSFSRTIKLPQEVDAGRVSAELNNGILEVVLPKSEKALAREIAIR